jgi:hypothetical protein
MYGTTVKMLFLDSINWRKEMQSEDSYYLGGKVYFVFLSSEDNAVTPSFEDYAGVERPFGQSRN